MSAPGPIIAHRGASADFPENTLLAIERAHAAGCDWVEIDTHMTADGAVILMHDHDLDRTTELSGFVCNHQLDDIRHARTRYSDGRISEERIPLLSDVLELTTSKGIGLVLEMKPTWGWDADEAIAQAALIPAAPSHPLLVTSFSVSALRAMRAARPDVELGLACIKIPNDIQSVAQDLGLRAVHCNESCSTEDDIARARDAGLDVAVATVNDAARAQHFLNAGAHGVMSDRPDLLRAGDAA